MARLPSPLWACVCVCVRVRTSSSSDTRAHNHPPTHKHTNPALCCARAERRTHGKSTSPSRRLSAAHTTRTHCTRAAAHMPHKQQHCLNAPRMLRRTPLVRTARGVAGAHAPQTTTLLERAPPAAAHTTRTHCTRRCCAHAPQTTTLLERAPPAAAHTTRTHCTPAAAHMPHKQQHCWNAPRLLEQWWRGATSEAPPPLLPLSRMRHVRAGSGGAAAATT